MERSFTKCGGEATRRTFSRKLKLRIFLDQLSKVLSSSFFIVRQVEVYHKISKLSCRPLACTSHKAFLKNKKKSGTSLPASFSA